MTKNTKTFSKLGLDELADDLSKICKLDDENKGTIANAFKLAAFDSFDHFLHKIRKEYQAKLKSSLGLERELKLNLPKLSKSGTSFSKAKVSLNSLDSKSWYIGRVESVRFSNGVFKSLLEVEPYVLVNDVANSKVTYLNADVRGKGNWAIQINSDIVVKGFPLVLDQAIATNSNALDKQIKKALSKRGKTQTSKVKASGSTVLWLEPVSYANGKPSLVLESMKTDGVKYQLAVTDQSQLFASHIDKLQIESIGEAVWSKGFEKFKQSLDEVFK